MTVDRRQELLALLKNDRYPRASAYDPEWILANEMGPHPLWLAEELCRHLELSPGMRVLDMGCGRAVTSVFLAKEFGVRVWANDLWIRPDENWERVREAGVADLVCPIHAEARQLPYAAGFFDAVVCLDSYHYYGTDDLYLRYFSRFVRPGGRIGILVPGLMRELEGGPPEHLTRRYPNGQVFWDPAECFSFHTLEWWRRHLAQTGLVEVEVAGSIPDGWRLWLQWERARDGGGFTKHPSEAPAIEEDGGRYIGFHVLVARKR